MASSKKFLDYILDQLKDLDSITFRAMMGEFMIYYKGKIVGGIYDDRFLVKPTQSAMKFMPNAKMEFPYNGAKPMLLVDCVDSKEYLCSLLNEMYDELPIVKAKKVKDKV